MEPQLRIPSNRMPAYRPEPVKLVAWLVLAVLGVIGIWFCVSHPIVGGMILLFVVSGSLLQAVSDRHWKQLATERRGDSICTFARSFNCRETDPWIVRAVFEQIEMLVRFPVRREDRLADDLKLDSDDVEEIAEIVAQRTGRELEGSPRNPFYGKIDTVGDLVNYFAHQPRAFFARD